MGVNMWRQSHSGWIFINLLKIITHFIKFNNRSPWQTKHLKTKAITENENPYDIASQTRASSLPQHKTRQVMEEQLINEEI